MYQTLLVIAALALLPLANVNAQEGVTREQRESIEQVAREARLEVLVTAIRQPDLEWKHSCISAMRSAELPLVERGIVIREFLMDAEGWEQQEPHLRKSAVFFQAHVIAIVNKLTGELLPSGEIMGPEERAAIVKKLDKVLPPRPNFPAAALPPAPTATPAGGVPPPARSSAVSSPQPAPIAKTAPVEAPLPAASDPNRFVIPGIFISALVSKTEVGRTTAPSQVKTFETITAIRRAILVLLVFILEGSFAAAPDLSPQAIYGELETAIREEQMDVLQRIMEGKDRARAVGCGRGMLESAIPVHKQTEVWKACLDNDYLWEREVTVNQEKSQMLLARLLEVYMERAHAVKIEFHDVPTEPQRRALLLQIERRSGGAAADSSRSAPQQSDHALLASPSDLLPPRSESRAQPPRARLEAANREERGFWWEALAVLAAGLAVVVLTVFIRRRNAASRRNR